MLYNQCKLSTRWILRQSKNPSIQKLYTLTISRHINHDSLINSVSTENQKKVLSNKQFNSRVDQNKSVFNHTWNRFMNLNEQQLLKICRVKVINMWKALTKWLPSNIFNFVGKHWFYVCLANLTFITVRLQKTINAFSTSNFVKLWKILE